MLERQRLGQGLLRRVFNLVDGDDGLVEFVALLVAAAALADRREATNILHCDRLRRTVVSQAVQRLLCGRIRTNGERHHRNSLKLLRLDLDLLI